MVFRIVEEIVRMEITALHPQISSFLLLDLRVLNVNNSFKINAYFIN